MGYVGRIVTFRNKTAPSYGAEVFESKQAMDAGLPVAFGKGSTEDIAKRHAQTDLEAFAGGAQDVQWE